MGFQKRPLLRRFSLMKSIILLTIFSLLTIFGLRPLFRVLHGELECFASEETLADIRYMIFAWDKLMSDLQLVHWIDFGTLLGQHRFQDVIPWDHDGDVAYLRKDFFSFRDLIVPVLRNDYDITIDTNNPVQMKYKGTTVDIFSYGTYTELNLKLPGQVKNGSETLTRSIYRDSYFFVESYADVSPNLVFPTKPCQFAGINVSCPRAISEVLKIRYAHSLHFTLPYKLRCYLQPWKLLQILAT